MVALDTITTSRYLLKSEMKQLAALDMDMWIPSSVTCEIVMMLVLVQLLVFLSCPSLACESSNPQKIAVGHF
jgi:hypothetical protein